jgi:branched-subunit amino acid ABC-type transport system permease component
MIEPELKNYLDKISKDTGFISKRQTAMRSFWYGVLSGFGSLLGAAVGLILIGYVLNVIGVIPALRSESDKWRATLEASTAKQIPSIQQNK